MSISHWPRIAATCWKILGAIMPSRCGLKIVPTSLAALRGRQFDAVAAVGDGPAVLAAEAAAGAGHSLPSAGRGARLPR